MSIPPSGPSGPFDPSDKSLPPFSPETSKKENQEKGQKLPDTEKQKTEKPAFSSGNLLNLTINATLAAIREKETLQKYQQEKDKKGILAGSAEEGEKEVKPSSSNSQKTDASISREGKKRQIHSSDAVTLSSSSPNLSTPVQYSPPAQKMRSQIYPLPVKQRQGLLPTPPPETKLGFTSYI